MNYAVDEFNANRTCPDGSADFAPARSAPSD